MGFEIWKPEKLVIKFIWPNHKCCLRNVPGAYAGILKGGFLCARIFGHAHFYSICGNSDHQYGKWSTSGVRYLKV